MPKFSILMDYWVVSNSMAKFLAMHADSGVKYDFTERAHVMNLSLTVFSCTELFTALFLIIHR